MAAASTTTDFLSLMSAFYRGEMARSNTWRLRLDRTANWAVILTATLLTWAFSTESRPHYILLIGIVMVTLFLLIEARRYRIYDLWRSRIRLIEEDVFANALDPEGVEHRRWRELLSDDLREPTLRTPLVEAVARRFRRIYFPLIAVLVIAWVIRLTVFEHMSRVTDASIGRIPGPVVVVGVVGYVGLLFLIGYWPMERHAKGELKTDHGDAEWREWKD
jgi:uncharacterized membrane protein